MFERLYHKGASILNKLLVSGIRPRLRSHAEIKAQLERYGITRPALLWDGMVSIEGILPLVGSNGGSGVPVFTLSLDATMNPSTTPMPSILAADSDVRRANGWIVASENPLDQSSLAGFLLESGLGEQIILNLAVFPETTSYYSYVDYLGGKDRTLIHINNYLRRCYGYPFPLALRLTLRSEKGEILACRQEVMPPDGSFTLTNGYFQKDTIKGYVEVEFEINRKVNQFLHYMADYFNEDHIFSNHQSGLGLHPTRSRFTRGYIPGNENETLEICLFQRNYSASPSIRAVLRYSEAGREEVREAHIKDLGKNEIRWIDAKSLFPETDFRKAKDALIEIDSDVPLHRPNYYYKSLVSGNYFDVSHAGPDLRFQVESVFGGIPEITGEEKEGLKALGIEPIDLRFFILPEYSNTDSFAGIGNDSTSKITKFQAKVYSCEGRLVTSCALDFQQSEDRFLNLTELLKLRPLLKDGGVVSLVALDYKNPVPIVMNGISAFGRRDGGGVTSTAASGSQPDNLPLYFRGGPPNYTGGASTYGVTEFFARGIRSPSFDTLFAISYPAAASTKTEVAVLEIQVISRSGERKSLRKRIQPNGSLFISLSSLLGSSPEFDEESYFTVWFTASGVHLYGQHVLIRTSDGALSLEHCYVGKFGY